MSLELILKSNVDFNKELKVAGIANIIAAAFGGLVGFHGLGNTVITAKFGLKTRWVGIICALSCFASVFFLQQTISYFPRFVLIGLILFLGVSLFYRWTFFLREKLNYADRIIIIAVIFITVFWGFIEGMIAGLIIAIIFFIFMYSRVDVIRYIIDGRELNSAHLRDPLAQKIIKNHGEKFVYIKLQDFLFFGSGQTLLDQLSEIFDKHKKEKVHFVLYDFERVSGIDSSVGMIFEKIKIFANAKDICIILTNFEHHPNRTLKKTLHFITLYDKHFLFMPNLDEALSFCEEYILEKEGYNLQELEDQRIALEDFLGDKSFVEAIPKYFVDQELKKGEYLFHQNDLSHDVFYLESGEVSIYIKTKRGKKKLLSTIGPGNLIGEVAFYLHSSRSASIVATKTSQLKRLSHFQLKKMAKEDPDLADAFNLAIICLLSMKLVDTTKKVEVLSR